MAKIQHSSQVGKLKMANLEQDVSFFDELEAAAKGLTVAADREEARDLRKLFESLKTALAQPSSSKVRLANAAGEPHVSGAAHHA